MGNLGVGGQLDNLDTPRQWHNMIQLVSFPPSLGGGVAAREGFFFSSVMVFLVKQRQVK